jgi:hypothetical protein
VRPMRAASVACLALLLSGCSGSEDPGPAQDEDLVDAAPADDNVTENPLADIADGNITDENETLPDGNATLNETVPRAYGIVYQQSFTGLLPVAGLQGNHIIAVPADADKIEIVYTSEHIGLFGAVARGIDPQGATRLDSLATCGAALSPGVATSTCTMALEEPLPAGDWTGRVIWQAGQVTEEYTLAVTVWGLLPLA